MSVTPPTSQVGARGALASNAAVAPAPGMMHAFVQQAYGAPDAVLRLEEIARPVARDDEVLIRVHAASINAADWHIMRGLPYIMRGLPYIMRIGWGRERPRSVSMGRDVAGTVEAVGRNVKTSRVGDEVYGECSTGSKFGQYARIREAHLALKPATLTFEQAAAVPLAGSTALQGLRDRGQLQAGQKVLINGASGGVGTFAVQLARAMGAEVTGVCSTRNMDMVRSIGAHHVIDYRHDDFTRGGVRYDLIFDLAGKALSASRRALALRGTLVLSAGDGGPWFGPIGRLLKAVALAPFVAQRLRPLAAVASNQSLATLNELLQSGKLTPVIDRTYPLAEVPQAMRYFEEEHARAKIVITM